MSKFKRNSNVVVNVKRHDVNDTSEKEVKHEPRESRILMIKTRDGKVTIYIEATNLFGGVEIKWVVPKK